MATKERKVGRPPKCGGCGECQRCKAAARSRRWYQAKTGDERKELRSRRNLDADRERDRRRYHDDPDRRKYVSERAKAWRKENPLASRAHVAVFKALKNGTLERGTECDQSDESCCGDLSAHHDDYTKPLEVRWLCRSHHTRYHAEHGSVAKGIV